MPAYREMHPVYLGFTKQRVRPKHTAITTNNFVGGEGDGVTFGQVDLQTLTQLSVYFTWRGHWREKLPEININWKNLWYEPGKAWRMEECDSSAMQVGQQIHTVIASKRYTIRFVLFNFIDFKTVSSNTFAHLKSGWSATRRCHVFVLFYAPRCKYQEMNA